MEPSSTPEEFRDLLVPLQAPPYLLFPSPLPMPYQWALHQMERILSDSAFTFIVFRPSNECQ